MTKIAELLDRDFSRPIEEIIKVNNIDQDTVHAELTEYVATTRIKAEYERLFRAMADGPKFPNEGVGVWISGFFGSGQILLCQKPLGMFSETARFTTSRPVACS